jgi:hypothetical protein
MKAIRRLSRRLLLVSSGAIKLAPIRKSPQELTPTNTIGAGGTVLEIHRYGKGTNFKPVTIWSQKRIKGLRSIS